MKEISMMSYIQEQESVCQYIINNRESILKVFLQNINAKKKHWFFFATGSSVNAINSVRYFLEQTCNIKVSIYDPSSFFYYMEYWDKEAVFFIISQSGKSSSTLNTINKLLLHNISDIFFLTANRYAYKSLYKILIECGEEKVGFVTKGFTSTILTLILMALEYAYQTNIMTHINYDLEIKKITNHCSLINNIIKESVFWYGKNRDILKGKNRYIILAYGDYLGIANEATTKLLETVRSPTSSYEIEEYMHGPYLELNHNHYLFFIESPGLLRERSKLLKKYIQEQGAACSSISEDADTGNFVLPQKGGFDFPLCSVILFQVISVLLSADKGIDIKVPIFKDFDDVLKSKI